MSSPACGISQICQLYKHTNKAQTILHINSTDCELIRELVVPLMNVQSKQFLLATNMKTH